MGFNSLLVVLNDAVHLIEEDRDFGKKVASAIRRFGVHRHEPGEGVDISSGNHMNAATVVRCQHADIVDAVVVGWNNAWVVGGSLGRPTEEKTQKEIIRSWARRLGYDVSFRKIKRDAA